MYINYSREYKLLTYIDAGKLQDAYIRFHSFYIFNVLQMTVKDFVQNT